MKKKHVILSGLAALTLFDIVGAQAQAQAQVANWTGYYIGAHTGYRWGNVSGSVPFATGFDGENFEYARVPFSGSPNSGIFGVHAGYNFMVSPNWLAGVEGAWSWGRGVTTFNRFSEGLDSFSTLSYRVELGWSASLRGRFGYVSNNWLFYGTGGIAFQQVKVAGSSASVDFNAFSIFSDFSQSKVLYGYVVGAGIEHLIVGGWTWRLEYLFADFGTKNFGPVRFDSFDISDTSQNVNLKVQTQTIRMGITKLFQP